MASSAEEEKEALRFLDLAVDEAAATEIRSRNWDSVIATLF